MPHATRRKVHATRRSHKPSRRVDNSARDTRGESDVVVYRPPTFTNVTVHKFRRIAAPITLTSSTVTETLYAFQFLLSYLPSYTEFTALYDQYQIASVELRIVPQVMTATPLDPLQGFIVLAVDYDDATTPANIDALYQYGSAAIFPASKEIRFVLRPRAALAAYSGAFTSYANFGNMWIDVASPSVQHYGLKVGMSASTPAHSWLVFPTYVLRLKSTR